MKARAVPVYPRLESEACRSFRGRTLQHTAENQICLLMVRVRVLICNEGYLAVALGHGTEAEMQARAETALLRVERDDSPWVEADPDDFQGGTAGEVGVCGPQPLDRHAARVPRGECSLVAVQAIRQLR